MTKLSTHLRSKAIRQEQFAKRIGVSQPEVSRFVNGTRQPSPEVAKRIEQETGGEVMHYDWPQYAAFAPRQKHVNAENDVQAPDIALQPDGVS